MSSERKPSLSGRLAVVTGGGGGIGGAICQVLAEKGARVIVADIKLDLAEAVLKTLPGEGDHRAVHLDVGQSASVEHLFEFIQEVNGGVPATIIVNCAGTGAPFTPISQATEADFDRIMDVNLKGPFLMCRTGIRLMLEAGVKEGSIVNIGSITGKVGMRGLASYTASKAGLVGLTKTVALDIADSGIRCNAVLPGYTITPLSANLTDEQARAIKTGIPLHRAAQPREIADVAAFLCGPESSYMTGAIVEVSGGAGM
ncbi:(3R)-3-hydroxyacyl-CoA dehydrogenase-like [Haemaphysalis longicornis]